MADAHKSPRVGTLSFHSCHSLRSFPQEPPSPPCLPPFPALYLTTQTLSLRPHPLDSLTWRHTQHGDPQQWSDSPSILSANLFQLRKIAQLHLLPSDQSGTASLCMIWFCIAVHLLIPSRSHSCEWPVSWSWLFLGRYINSISSPRDPHAWVRSRGGSSQDFRISCCLKDKVLPYRFVIQGPFASDASLCFQTRLFFLPSWSPSRQPKWSLLGPVDMLHYLFLSIVLRYTQHMIYYF